MGGVDGFARIFGVRRFIISEYREEKRGKKKVHDVEGKYACKTSVRYKDAVLQRNYKNHISVISNSPSQTFTTFIRH